MTESFRKRGYISRRDFLKISTLVAVGAGIAACEPRLAKNPGMAAMSSSPPNSLAEDQYPDIPYAPAEPPPYILEVLTFAEAQTVEALTARLYPGDSSDPGAREAGVTNYIDKMLTFHNGYVEYTYIHAPHAKAYEGDQPPAQKSDEHGEIIWVKKSEMDRYGFQSLKTPVQLYRDGLTYVDRYSNQKFGKDFVDLATDQQDKVLEDMENGNAAAAFDDPTDKNFFKMLQLHTIQGMFADPAYGGNKDMIGWKQIGYPGAQRAYTPQDMNTEGPVRPPQSLAMLHRFHAGMNSNPNVIVPPSGSQNMPGH